MIRLLKVAKDSVIDGRTRALNQGRSLLVTAPMALRERLSGLSRNELITTCASFLPGELVDPLAAARRALRSLARRIQAPDAELKELMADLDGLTQAACPGRRQSYGIGIDGAAVLLTAVGDNPERIRSEAAFAAICGASPLQASSGNSRHHRLNRGGNRQANATLHRIAVVRLRWHEQTKVRRTPQSRRAQQQGHPALPQTVHRQGGVPSADGQTTPQNRGHMNGPTISCSGSEPQPKTSLRGLTIYGSITPRDAAGEAGTSGSGGVHQSPPGQALVWAHPAGDQAAGHARH
ncbi:IS110 family transposase [Cyanobium sp. Cruz CV13-4-11]|uniref:transposase n=1 Tax=unclassified Cyanobium TaxID=2627006 RepID=UPI0020CCE963|nr:MULTISPECIES: transposase [unclassified Cyanobium]MCP9899408.1 IS110 family transposase [Cyanobium sp. Cruz CV11-17]MCP9921156.1 IS110 family transposase [Cyanobium sp. Cruz CV13-4-11]